MKSLCPREVTQSQGSGRGPVRGQCSQFTAHCNETTSTSWRSPVLEQTLGAPSGFQGCVQAPVSSATPSASEPWQGCAFCLPGLFPQSPQPRASSPSPSEAFHPVLLCWLVFPLCCSQVISTPGGRAVCPPRPGDGVGPLPLGHPGGGCGW